ncbi:MAG TPA: methyltransferase domain-containing protein [Nitrospiraceae bacterium]|nr:methyltransferase domain-containing protein [Nitrospiraceae bacterium]
MANYVDEMTERLLDDAGIGQGMRVLDIGCGPGAVSLMLSRRVGNEGHVCAIARHPRMLESARENALQAGVSNLTFIEGGFDVAFPERGTLDAVVGRRVLMYQPNAAQAVAQLTDAIRTGGVIAFHEHDMVAISDSGASLPLHDQVRSWLHEMLRREGANLHMGFELHSALSAAGLVVERVRAEANVLTPTAGYPVAAIIRAVLPRLLQLGITTEADVDVETLDDRLAAERRKTRATCLWEMVFCAWGRKSASPST